MLREVSLPFRPTPDVCYFTIKSSCCQQNSNNNNQDQLSPAPSPTSTEFNNPLATPPSPVNHPINPLLASRPQAAIASPPANSTTSFLQMQTAAAHGSPSRPRPFPVQNVLHVTSDDSASSASTSASSNSSSDSTSCSSSYDSRYSFEAARCSRCQRTPSVDIRTGKSNMVSYGLNLWYCSRCASLVGLAR